jgi:DNA mismatch repair protein MutL
VDVNVHPAKREVRFRESMRISAIIAAALRNALRGMNSAPVFATGTIPPSKNDTKEEPEAVFTPAVAPAPAATPLSGLPTPPPANTSVMTPVPAAAPAPMPAAPAMPAFEPIQSPLPFSDTAAPREPRPVQAAPGGESPTPPPSSSPLAQESLSFRLLGALGQQHLLAENPGGLIVVNIRAAMQRIVFERLLANLDSGQPVQQPLLMPITVNLAPDEARIMNHELDHFSALGYSVEPFGAGTFLVTAVPAGLNDNDIVNMVRDVISDLHHETVTTRKSAIHLAQTAARHSVRQLRAPLTVQEQQSLLYDLTHCRMPYTDPAGLPTMVHITYSELSKRFNP